MTGWTAGTSPQAGDAAAVPQLGPVLEAAGAHVAELLERTERRLADVAHGHGEELARHVSLTLSAGGKRMRPLLVFVCADGAASRELVSAGVAVELLHMATLVHDDVLDRAPLRRGRPTVYVTGGRLAATASGDFLLSRAFAELTSTGRADAVLDLSDAASALARGELMQREDAWSGSVTTERYLERCSLKTARLFGAACRLGARLGARGADAAGALGSYGERIGLAFQLLDDVLDVAGPVERTGKHRGTDLLDGTVTLPLILARERDAALTAVDLRSLQDGAAAEAVCERVAKTGALDECRRRALAYVSEAKRALTDIPVSADARRALELAADGVVERYG